MKRFALIFVLAAAFAVTGIGAQENYWYISGREGGSRARDNTVTLRTGTNYIYIYFTNGMPGGDFEKIQLNFTLDRPLEVIWQAAYNNPDQTWGSEVSAGTIDSGPIETDFASFTQRWSGRGTAFSKRNVVGMCLAIVVPSRSGNATFTMTSIQFIGLQQ